MNACAQDCRRYARMARLDGLPNTAAVFARAANINQAQDAEILRLRAALRSASGPQTAARATGT